MVENSAMHSLSSGTLILFLIEYTFFNQKKTKIQSIPSSSRSSAEKIWYTFATSLQIDL